MAMTAKNVSFPQGVTVSKFPEETLKQAPASPQIVAAGQATFPGGSTVEVSFPKAVSGPYFISLCGNGSGCGQMADPHETFAVIHRTEGGFKIRCSSRVTRSTVDWIICQ